MHFPCYDLALADTDVIEHANCFDQKRKHLKILFSGNMKSCHVSVDNMQNRINKNDPRAVRDNAISLTNKFHVAVRLYLALINRAGGLYGRILTEVVSTDRTQ